MLEFDDKLNEQAIQFEILIHKVRPDLLESYKRPDVTFSSSNPMQASRDIMHKHGVLKGGKTVLLD